MDAGDKLRFLADPASYPDHPTRVETIETHFSWVFLTDRHAYKLKKPVHDGFDFRSLAARYRNGIAELRLNRRLAEDIYLGLVPLTLQRDGTLALAGPGRPVDWLVQMARLEADRMFDRRLQRSDWHYAEIDALAHRLAAFFAAARPVRVSPVRLAARMRAELSAALAASADAGEPRLLATMKPVIRRLDAFLTSHDALFRRRVWERRIVDGHGDLRPEHIYLRGRPRVIDCLEFRDDLRQLDPVSELAYLALECRRLGGPSIEHTLLRRYRERTGDAPPAALVHFYRALNAVMRARIAILHLAEPGGHTHEELVCRAAEYLAVAAAALPGCRTPQRRPAISRA